MFCSFRIRFQEAVIPICSPHSKLVVTLAATCPEDKFNDLAANLIIGVMMLSMVVKILFWILSSTVSTLFPIFLPIQSVVHLLSIWTFTVFSLVVGLPLILLTLNSRSTGPLFITTFCLPLLTASPIITSWLKSSNWLRSLLFFAPFSGELKPYLICELYLLLNKWNTLIVKPINLSKEIQKKSSKVVLQIETRIFHFEQLYATDFWGFFWVSELSFRSLSGRVFLLLTDGFVH